MMAFKYEKYITAVAAGEQFVFAPDVQFVFGCLLK